MTATYAPPAPTSAGRPRGFRALIATSAMIGALFLVGNSVFAQLNATASNPSAQSINSGTLILTMTKNGAGFDSLIEKMAPGDKVARFLQLDNAGKLAGKDLTLAATLGETATKLANDGTNGLQVVVDSCASAWTGVTSWQGTCSGGSTTVLTTTLNALRTAPVALTGFSNIAAESSIYLRVTITLPDQAETSTNGTLPPSTIQGLTQTVTWTFAEVQRTATNTAS
jgi:hypothetical protein